MGSVDVVVVGGGPAGAVTAMLLARTGVDVTIVERARFPRRKVCGEYLSVGTVGLLDEVGLGPMVRAHAGPLRGVRLVPPLADPVVLCFPGPALAIARETLDALLLDAACAAGAHLVKALATDVAIREGRVAGVVVRDDAGQAQTLNARVVVGADGSGSVIARRLGLVRPSRGPRRFAVGGHYAGFGSLNGLIEMYVGTGAYFAVNPLDVQRANVMVVVRERALAQWSRDVDVGIKGKAAQLARGDRSLDAAQRIGSRVAVGPLAFDVRAVATPGAVLVGDASGFLNPFTGQGIYLALAGALAASRAVAGTLAAPARETEIFAKYGRERRNELRRRRALSSLVSAMIDVPLLARRATAKLSRLPEAADGLMAAISGIASPETALTPAAVARLLL